MDISIVLTARNEGEWSLRSANNFRKQFPDSEIIGVDDGGVNQWPDFVKKIKTQGEVGVGRCRLEGVKAANGDVVIISDAHVFYGQGDLQKAVDLACNGNVVTFTTVSLFSGRAHGCGRTHELNNHGAKNVKAKDGDEAGLIGGVYYMRKDVALDVIAPTPSHGFNEQIMTYAALSLGHPIYCYPDLHYRHMYKKKFNYSVKSDGQQRNLMLLKWWFFDHKKPTNASRTEQAYYDMIQKKRVLNARELTIRMKAINDKLRKNGSN